MKFSAKKILFTFCLLLTFTCFKAYAKQGKSPAGIWFTIDDKTGVRESEIKLWVSAGKLYGSISKIIAGDNDAICGKCTGSLKNKPILGMQIINGLEFDSGSGKWKGAKAILDPKTGSYHDVEIWLEGSKLKVRGYLSFLYRTQTWEPKH
jgi:hypothetical protein